MWRRLREKLAGRTRHEPPTVASGDDAARLKDALNAFHERDPKGFRNLFLRSKPARESDGFDLFAAAGLVTERLPGAYVPCVRVFPLDGAMIATDLLTHADEDQVFSLMLEQVYIVAQMGIREHDRALELCVGSGVNSLFLSDVADRVVAVDVSRRALSFARFNAALNPGRVPVELREGSLFAPLEEGERFDYVLVNPPFEPVPPGARHFLHSHGGEDGLDVVREILEEAPGRLEPDGRFEIFTWSPGDEGNILLADLLRGAFPGARIEVHRVDHRPLDDRIAQFRKEEGFASWRERLRAKGYTRVWGVFARVDADGPAETQFVTREDVLAFCDVVLDEWS